MKKIKQKRAYNEIKKENFSDGLIPVIHYNDSVVVHSNPIYNNIDSQWNKDYYFIDAMKEKLSTMDIINKTYIISETFRNRFTSIFLMNVNSIFEYHNKLILENKKIIDILSNINLMFLHEDDISKEENFLCYHLNIISNCVQPTYYDSIIHNVNKYDNVFNETINRNNIYNDAFNIETYFTNDPTIVVDLTNLFSSYLIKNALSVLYKYGTISETLTKELNDHILALSSDLYDILSVLFITMYDTAKQYNEFINALECQDGESLKNNKEELNAIITNAIDKLSILNNNK